MASFSSTIDLPASPAASWAFVVDHGHQIESLTFQETPSYISMRVRAWWLEYFELFIRYQSPLDPLELVGFDVVSDRKRATRT